MSDDEHRKMYEVYERTSRMRDEALYDELKRLRGIEVRLNAKIQRLKEGYDPRLVYIDHIRLALIEEFEQIRDGSGDDATNTGT